MPLKSRKYANCTGDYCENLIPAAAMNLGTQLFPFFSNAGVAETLSIQISPSKFIFRSSEYSILSFIENEFDRGPVMSRLFVKCTSKSALN